MSLASLIADLPQALRTAVNKHRYVVFGSSGIRTMATSKKDVETLVASLLGQWGVSSFSGLAQRLVALGLVGGMMLSSGGAWAIPTNANTTVQGGTLTNPDANKAKFIGAGNMVATTTDFNTLAGQTIRIRHTSGNGYFLGKISGGPTNFLGNLFSNGNVLLVNPGGIIFGASSAVNVGSLTASTLPLNMTDAQFMAYNGTGNLTFDRNGGLSSAINNLGHIKATAGDVVLLASRIGNNGTIQSTTGNVHLAVGNKVTLATSGGVLVDVTVDEALSQKVGGLQDAIFNNTAGTITGNMIKMQADLDSSLYDRAINNKGRIEATTVASVDGAIVLKASGGETINQGTIASTGTIDITNTNDDILNQDVGVVLPGVITADGDITISAAKRVALGGLTGPTGGDITSTNGNISIETTDGSSASNQILNYGGNITANNGNISLDSANGILNNRSGDIFGKTVDVTGVRAVQNVGNSTIDATDTLNVTSTNNRVRNQGISRIGNTGLTTANVSAKSRIHGSGQFLAQTLNLTATDGNIGTDAANPLMIDADTVTLNAGDSAFVSDLDNIDLGASNVANMLALASTGAGEVIVTGNTTAKNVAITNNNGNLDVSNGVSVTGETVDFTATGETEINTGASVTATNGALNITADSDNNQNGNVLNKGTIQANNGRVTIDARKITNDATGQILSDVDQIHLKTGAPWNYSAKIEGNDIINRGTITAATRLNMQAADDIENTGGTIQAQTVDAFAADDIKVDGGSVHGTANVNFITGDAASPENFRDITITDASVTAANRVNLNAGDDIIIEGNSTIGNGNKVDITAGDNIDIRDRSGNTPTIAGSEYVNVNAADELATDGMITSSGGGVTLHSVDNVTNDATVSGTTVAVTSDDDITNNGSLTSTTGDVTITSAVGSQQSNVTNNGSISSAAKVAINSGDSATPGTNDNITNTGSIAAAGDVTLNAGDSVANNGTGSVTSTGGTVKITAADKFTSEADSAITGNQGVDIDANTVDTDGAITATNNDVTIDTVGNLKNDGTIESVSRHVLLTSDMGEVENTGTVEANRMTRLMADTTAINSGSLSGSRVVMLAFDNVENSTGGTIEATDTVELRSRGNSTVHLEGADIINNGGIDAGGAVTITSRDDFDNTGSVQGASVAITTMDDVTNTAPGSITSTTGDITIDALGSTVTNSGAMSSANDLIINAGDSGTFQEGDDIINTTAGTLFASRDVVLNAGDDVENSGDIRGRDVDIDAAHRVENKVDAFIKGRRNLDIDAKSVRNDGRLFAKREDLTINASVGTIFNTETGSIEAEEGKVTLTADTSNIINQGDIDAAKKAKIEATNGSVANGGDIHGNNIVIRVKEDITNQVGGHIHADNNVTLDQFGPVAFAEGQDIINNGSIEAGGDVTINSNDDVTIGVPGDILGTNVTITAADDILINGLVDTHHGPGDISKVTKTTKIPLEGDTVTLDAGNNVTIGVNGVVHGAKMVDAKAGNNITVNGAVESGLSDFRFDYSGSGPHTGTVKLDAVNNVTVGVDGLILADNTVDVDAGNNITVNGLVEAGVHPDDIFSYGGGGIPLRTLGGPIPFTLEGGDVDLNAGNDVTVSATGGIFAGNSITGTAVNNINVDGIVSALNLSPRVAVRTAAAVPPPVAPGSVNLTATNGDITVSDGGIVIGQNLVSGNAGNNIQIDGTVIAGQPLLFSRPATRGGSPVPGLLFGGNIELDAGNDINVSESGAAIAGSRVDATAQNDITIDGLVEAYDPTMGRGGPGRRGPVSPRDRSGVVTLDAIDGDITVGKNGEVIASRRVRGDAGNNITVKGLVQAGYEDDGIFSYGGGSDALSEGRVALDAGKNIKVTSKGEVRAGHSIDATAGKNITINGIVETPSASSGDVIKPSRTTKVLIDDTHGDITLTAGKNITVNDSGRVSAAGDVTGTAGNDIINDGLIEAGVETDDTFSYGGGGFSRPGHEAIPGEGDVRLITENNISGTGLTRGDLVRLKAKNGDVGSEATPFETEANKLRINANNGSAFVNEADDVILRKSNAQDDLQVTSKDAGDITITGEQTGTDIVIDNKSGDIIVNNTVTATNTADVTAENSISGTGTVGGDLVKLKAKNGNIGSAADPLNTDANKLRITAKNGSAFVDEADDVKLRRGQAQGTLQVTSIGAGDIDIKGEQTATDITINNDDGSIQINNLVTGDSSVSMAAQGDIDVNADVLGNDNVNLSALDGNLSGPGLVSGEEMVLNASDGITLDTNASFLTTTSGGTTSIFDANSVIIRSMVAGGNLRFSNGTNTPGVFDPLGSGTVLAGRLQGDQVFVDVVGSLLDGNGGAVNLVANGASRLTAGGIIGTIGDPFDVLVRNGSLSVGANGQVAGTSIVINGVVNPSNTLNVLGTPPGAVIFNGNFLALGSLGDALNREGLPYLTVDYNRLRDLFNKAFESVDGVIGDGETTAVEAQIINERTDFGQPFDLRLIEEDGGESDDGGFSFVAVEDESSED